ncbi:D-hexose-6-phosphate mutarotase [Alkalimonas delamerensis]|uniref:Putative glucose-6-phosphate 1-epimerase n=1 Tax=Alkalimonas delamerensis TaxID=265981 RepID=A0ABT9GPD0_9GAMM|nr:D-hexose-6-phosphate mutarotase [Alkalimonas delamerensis]MDP4528640.1 D-hexose-6-phosphate mutarotase [Alkalimonas delamerensis]
MPCRIEAITGFAHLSTLPCYRLQAGAASAVISLYGAQVLSYQPVPADERLWLSPMASWQGKAIRGGIPICWPWFGPADPAQITDAAAQPSHGLARTRLWQLHSQECRDDSALLCLHSHFSDLPQTDLQQIAVPHRKPVELQLQLRLSAEALEITLRCDEAIYQQAALHSYFRCQDPAQLKVHGLGPRYDDKVTASTVQKAGQPAVLLGETDRIYRQPATTLRLQDGATELKLQQQGHDSAILWNPGADKSQALADVPNEGYLDFVCVESARLTPKPAPLQLVQRLLPR